MLSSFSVVTPPFFNVMSHWYIKVARTAINIWLVSVSGLMRSCVGSCSVPNLFVVHTPVPVATLDLSVQPYVGSGCLKCIWFLCTTRGCLRGKTI